MKKFWIKYSGSGDGDGLKNNRTHNDDDHFPATGDCFVATACYGFNDELVLYLQKRRDEILKEGKAFLKILFINCYYKLYLGKMGAWILYQLPFLKPIARVLIEKFKKSF